MLIYRRQYAKVARAISFLIHAASVAAPRMRVLVSNVVAIVSLMSAGVVHGAVVIYDAGTGYATGIDGLVVQGEIYNVDFIDASYDTAYASRAPTFFGDKSGANAASNAMMDILNAEAVVPQINASTSEVLFVPYAFYVENEFFATQVGHDVGTAPWRRYLDFVGSRSSNYVRYFFARFTLVTEAGPAAEYDPATFAGRISGGSLIDFEGIAVPGGFEYFGNPGQFSEAGVTIVSNSPMFLQNNNLYGTGAFLSPQQANPEIVDIALPPQIVAIGFWYQSAAATVELDGGQLFELPAVSPGSFEFFGIARETSINSLRIVVAGPGIDIDNIHFSDEFQFSDTAHILWRNTVTGQNWLYLMNGATIDSSIGINTVPTVWKIVGNGDYNGDGKSDILWRNSVTGQNWMYLMDGSTVVSSVNVNTVPNLDWHIVSNGDYDGDGKPDILWRNSSTGQNWMYLMDGATILSSLSVNTVPTVWQVASSGDHNGDGKSDILWRNSSTGQNWLYVMNGATIETSTGVNTVADLNWQVAGHGDYDSDGKSDILWRNSVTGQNWMYLMDGSSITNSVGVNTLPDTNWKVAGSSDYNGDGKADIFWRNSSTGQNWMYLMNGAAIMNSVGVNTVSNTAWEVVNTN